MNSNISGKSDIFPTFSKLHTFMTLFNIYLTSFIMCDRQIHGQVDRRGVFFTAWIAMHELLLQHKVTIFNYFKVTDIRSTERVFLMRMIESAVTTLY